jgi:hypothetical protein
MKELLDAMQDSWSKWSARETSGTCRRQSLVVPLRPRPDHPDALHQRRVVLEPEISPRRRVRVGQARLREVLEEPLPDAGSRVVISAIQSASRSMCLVIAARKGVATVFSSTTTSSASGIASGRPIPPRRRVTSITM